MKGDLWKRIDAAFDRALDLPPDEQRAFLEGVEDDATRRAVRELLRSAEDSASFLETPIDEQCSPPWDEIFADAARAPPDEATDRSGERIGPYRLVRRLGRGGMATVYLAERADGLWRQEVALKLIRRGLESEDVVRRFLAERQILSSVRHPNIASLLDGGTTPDGLPYLVMERVEGTPITDYCDEHRLTVEARLRLACEVGRAVQHAHRSLVVHRDLKPSNILVTDEGRVKLLDFGIAKLHDPGPEGGAEDLTRPGRLPMTPGYASPEQLAGRPITTASDVYQLGVLLHHLLTGRRPPAARLSAGSTPEATLDDPVPPSRAIRQGSGADGDGDDARRVAASRATSPRGLLRRVEGDLDTIVATSLRPEPEERYASVGALVEDLERHLEQIPIRARAPTRRYRVRKFLERNPWVAPVTVAAVLLTAGYGLSMHRQARALERERNLATAEAERAEAIQSFLTGLFQTADPFAPDNPQRGREMTVAEALDVGSERARTELADRPALQADMFDAIAGVYASLDLTAPAVRLRRDALELARRVHGPGSPEVAERLHALGSAVSNPDSAGRLLASALELAEETHGPGSPAYAEVLVSLGYLEIRLNRYEDAVGRLERAVRILRDAEPPPEGALASAMEALAMAYPHVNRPEDAAEAGRWALDRHRRTLGEGHPRTAIAMARLADAHDGLGQSERAIELYRQALPTLDRSLGPDHSQTIVARNNLGVSLFRTGRFAEAEEVNRRMLEIRTAKFGESHEEVADGLQNLAATLNALGRSDEAERTLQRARSVYLDALGPDHFRATLPLLTLSEIRLDREDFEGAEAVASEAAATLRRALPDGHFVTAVAECRWGLALAGLGGTERATALVEGAAADLLETPQGGGNRRGCLEAAYRHLSEVDTAPELRRRIAASLELSPAR